MRAADVLSELGSQMQASPMKTMAGAFFRATANKSRMRAAATPSNISTNSEPLAEKKATSEEPAMALARYVFPVPGGPSSRIPCAVMTISEGRYRLMKGHDVSSNLISNWHLAGQHCKLRRPVVSDTQTFLMHAREAVKLPTTQKNLSTHHR